MSLSNKRILIFFIPLFLSLPFLNRAYFVDDQFFIRIAEWLKDNPSRPYDFAKPENGVSSEVSQTSLLASIVNPLLHHYYLAFLMRLRGGTEWFLRGGCVMLSCFSALIIFELARRWTAHPFQSALLVLLTPAFWVSAHSLLIDPTLNLFFLSALYFMVRAFETKLFPFAIISGISIGLALLTKYTGILIVPLILFWWFLSKDRNKTMIHVGLGLVLGAVFHFSYLFLTKAIYGQSHLSASLALTLTSISWGKLLVLSVFLTGGFITPLFCWGLLRLKLFVLASALAALVSFIFASPWGGLTLFQGVYMGVFSLSLLLSWGQFYELRAEWKNPGDHFIFFWSFAFFGMMAIVMPWVAIRYLLISVPAFVFMSVRLIEVRRPAAAARIFTGLAIIMFVVSLPVVIADYWQAESARYIRKELEARGLNKYARRFYFSDSFTMAYLKRDGWQPCPEKSKLQPGDKILVSEISMPLSWFFRQGIPVKSVAVMEYASRFPVKVMDSKTGAALYGSIWGPLPYSFSRSPWERFRLFEVINPVGNY